MFSVTGDLVGFGRFELDTQSGSACNEWTVRSRIERRIFLCCQETRYQPSVPSILTEASMGCVEMSVVNCGVYGERNVKPEHVDFHNERRAEKFAAQA